MHLTPRPVCWDVPGPNPALQPWPAFKLGLMGRAPHLTLPFSSPQNLPEMNSVLTLTQAKSFCLERPFYICSTEEEHMLILAMADPLGLHLRHTQYTEFKQALTRRGGRDARLYHPTTPQMPSWFPPGPVRAPRFFARVQPVAAVLPCVPSAVSCSVRNPGTCPETLCVSSTLVPVEQPPPETTAWRTLGHGCRSAGVPSAPPGRSLSRPQGRVQRRVSELKGTVKTTGVLIFAISTAFDYFVW